MMNKYLKTFFITLFLATGITLLQARARSVSRLKLRVGTTEKIGGYNKIIAKSSGGKVHISKNSDGSHSVTGMDDGMIILYGYDDDDELILEQPFDVKERRQESSANVGFSIGVGGPGYWITSDPPYDPFYGWGYPYWRYPRRYRRGYYYGW